MCKYAQGYHFARPAPANVAERLLLAEAAPDADAALIS
jgi:EAL domain-containing protein (putative c-di-GMP-specific phosphodiesterase class I)